MARANEVDAEPRLLQVNPRIQSPLGLLTSVLRRHQFTGLVALASSIGLRLAGETAGFAYVVIDGFTEMSGVGHIGQQCARESCMGPDRHVRSNRT
jgi:hypothetical protein